LTTKTLKCFLTISVVRVIHREYIDSLWIDQLVSNGNIQESLDPSILLRDWPLTAIDRAVLWFRAKRNIGRKVLDPKVKVGDVVVLATFVNA